MKIPRFEFFVVFLVAVLPVLYGSGYVWARLTHRLVWYGSFVARPRAMSGIGYSDWELLFLPPSWIEAQVRNNLP